MFSDQVVQHLVDLASLTFTDLVPHFPITESLP